MATTLILRTIANAPPAGAAIIGQSDVKSDPASATFAKESGPKESKRVDRTAIGNPLWAIPLKSLTATLDRPLFSPTRHPPTRLTASADPPRAKPPIRAEKPPLVLVGTVISDNEAIGIFRDQSTKRMVRLRSGERQDGWLLDRVHKRDVVLRKDNSDVFLSLSADAATPVTVAMREPGPRLVRRQR